MDRQKLEQMITFLEKAREAAIAPELVDPLSFRKEYIDQAYGIFGNKINDIPTEINNCFTSYLMCCVWKRNGDLYNRALTDGDKRLRDLRKILEN